MGGHIRNTRNYEQVRVKEGKREKEGWVLEVCRVANKQVQTQVQGHRKTSGQWLDCAAVVKWSGKPFGPVWEVFS